MKTNHTLTAMLCALLFTFVVPQIHAGSATWLAAPGSGDWNTATNWTPATVPNANADVATFATSGTTGVSVSANTTITEIVFNPVASAFTISTLVNGPLNVIGAGITNNSGITQSFVLDAGAGGM